MGGGASSCCTAVTVTGLARQRLRYGMFEVLTKKELKAYWGKEGLQDLLGWLLLPRRPAPAGRYSACARHSLHGTLGVPKHDTGVCIEYDGLRPQSPAHEAVHRRQHGGVHEGRCGVRLDGEEALGRSTPARRHPLLTTPSTLNLRCWPSASCATSMGICGAISSRVSPQTSSILSI